MHKHRKQPYATIVATFSKNAAMVACPEIWHNCDKACLPDVQHLSKTNIKLSRSYFQEENMGGDFSFPAQEDKPGQNLYLNIKDKKK